MQSLTHTSLVRNDNHFIYLLKGYPHHINKWYLIDGPWFEYLEKIRKDQSLDLVLLLSYQKMDNLPLEECDITSPLADKIFWEYHEIPYYHSEKGVMLFDIYHCYKLYEACNKLQGFNFDVLSMWLSRTTIIRAWQCNDGVLPAWIKNEHWDENLEELFSYTQYMTHKERKEFNL